MTKLVQRNNLFHLDLAPLLISISRRLVLPAAVMLGTGTGRSWHPDKPDPTIISSWTLSWSSMHHLIAGLFDASTFNPHNNSPEEIKASCCYHLTPWPRKIWVVAPRYDNSPLVWIAASVLKDSTIHISWLSVQAI